MILKNWEVTGVWFNTGRKMRVTVFGSSHGLGVGMTMEGIPPGISIDLEEIKKALERRKPQSPDISTGRKEDDSFEILSGIKENITDGSPITVFIRNKDIRSGDYGNLKFTPRPGHADYPAMVKYKEGYDERGGSFFSGRMTAPLVICGAICYELLKREGITIGSHIYSIERIKDKAFDPVTITKEQLSLLSREFFPLIDKGKEQEMKNLIKSAKEDEDSLGGIIECGVTGLSPGIGSPRFMGLDSFIGAVMFSIPGVKGVEFGSGFRGTTSRGSRNNDQYRIKEGRVVALKNNAGGVLGGLSTGMPLLFRVAFKPVASIGREQKTVNLKTMKETVIRIEGRHDPCIVPRAASVVEAACAICLYDEMRYEGLL